MGVPWLAGPSYPYPLIPESLQRANSIKVPKEKDFTAGRSPHNWVSPLRAP